jgi:hypothetical protein
MGSALYLIKPTFLLQPFQAGRFINYQERNGMLIPLDGEVAWNLPDGDLSYWRGRIEAIEYQPE